jgi:thiamine-phosphate pyrophosphorylase
MLPKLQYISQGQTLDQHLANIRAVLDAGGTFIQLRLKDVDDAVYLETGLKAAELCHRYKAMLVVNDNPLVAAKCGADAIHLGLDDLPVAEARKLAPNKLIGGTANTIEHIVQRCSEKVDYIGLGPYRFTTTKAKLSPVLGVEGYKNCLEKMKALSLHTPVYAIGGIEREDIEAIMKSGVYGIAVSGMLTHADDKARLVKEINQHLYYV